MAGHQVDWDDVAMIGVEQEGLGPIGRFEHLLRDPGEA